MSPLPTFADVQAAARRLEGVTIRTPLLENERVNRALGGRLFIKAECLQRTGSFKLRGAYNFLAAMTDADRAKGVVGWSSGNHAQGLAEAARLKCANIACPSTDRDQKSSPDRRIRTCERMNDASKI